MSFTFHADRRDDTCFDIGARVGIYTILAAGGRQMQVEAFEPGYTAHQRLIAHIHLNRLEHRVKTHVIAFVNNNGQSVITTDLGPENRLLTDEKESNSAPGPVAMWRLDELDLSTPHIMKVDVEGCELEVLKGAKKTLNSDTLFAVILETDDCCHRYGWSRQETRDMLEKHGFKPYHYEPYSRALVQLANPEIKINNTIYI